MAVVNGFSIGAAPQLRAVAEVRQMASVRMEDAPAVKETPAEEKEAVEEALPPVEYSKSLPMLVKRPQLKGYAGDVGFDPVGFSEIFSMVWPCPEVEHGTGTSHAPYKPTAGWVNEFRLNSYKPTQFP